MTTGNLDDLRRQFETAKDAEEWDRAAELSQQINDLEIEQFVVDTGKVDIVQAETEEEFVEAVFKMPFMPEKGVPLPEYAAKALYPSATWGLMEPPMSDYGKEVVNETARMLKEFMTGGNFIISEKFKEGGWSSENIDYMGKLIHTPTLNEYIVQIMVFFKWRTPSEIDVATINLWRDVGEEYPVKVWDGGMDADEGRIADAALSGRLEPGHPRGVEG
jgi:hypothetical protein